MRKIKSSKQFKKDLKRFQNDKSFSNKLNDILKLLISGKPLPEKNKDHPLSGKWSKHRDCHVKPNVVLIYMLDDQNLYLERIGSHSELFK